MRHKRMGTYRRVILSPLQEMDIEALRLLRNRERRWFIYSEEIDAESQQRWYKKYLQTKDDYMFSIAEVKKPDVFIGAVALYNFNNVKKSCEFGRIVIDCNIATEKGLGYDAVICACKIGFEQLGLHLIELEVFNDNIPSIKTYHKAGFTCRSEHDKLLSMTINKDEFYKLLKRNEEMSYVNTSLKTEISR